MKFAAAVSLFVASVAANGKAPAPHADYEKPTAQRVEVAPIPVCDDKTPYDPEVGCVEVAHKEPVLKCPAGYNQHKDGCQVTQYGKSSVVCQKGSYLKDNHCFTEIIGPIDVSCPKGKGELTDEGCLVRAEPVVIPPKHADLIYTCDKGFNLEKDTCVRQLSSDATLVCDDHNAKLVGSNCIIYDYQDMECPKGYVRNGKQCEAVSSVPVDLICPKGSHESKDGTCLVEVTAKPIMVCEKGYELNAKNGNCEARVLLQGIMPGNKNPKVPIDCRLGQLDKDGNCYQIHTSPAIAICEDGFELDEKEHKCTSYVHVDHEDVCPDTHSKDHHQCIHVSTKNPSCPQGYTPDSGFNKKSYGECVRAITSTYSYVCPDGYNLAGSKKHKKVNSSCSAVETVPAHVSCPKGYDHNGKDCIIPGWVESGKDQYYPPDYACPKGHSMDKKNMSCMEILKSKPLIACEKGYELDGHRCVATFDVPAQLICPIGFIYSDEEEHMCEKISYTRPKFVCPKNSYSHGNKCYVDAEPDEIVLVESSKKGISASHV